MGTLGSSSTEPQASTDCLEDSARSSQATAHWDISGFSASRDHRLHFWILFIRDIGGGDSGVAISTIQAPLTTNRSDMLNTSLASLTFAAYDRPGEAPGAGWRSQDQVCSGEGTLTTSVKEDKEQNNSMETRLSTEHVHFCVCVCEVVQCQVFSSPARDLSFWHRISII